MTPGSKTELRCQMLYNAGRLWALSQTRWRDFAKHHCHLVKTQKSYTEEPCYRTKEKILKKSKRICNIGPQHTCVLSRSFKAKQWSILVGWQSTEAEISGRPAVSIEEVRIQPPECQDKTVVLRKAWESIVAFQHLRNMIDYQTNPQSWDQDLS